jgi:hypothetical protein
MNKLLTAKEMGALLRISQNHLYTLAPQLGGIKVGRSWRFVNPIDANLGKLSLPGLERETCHSSKTPAVKTGGLRTPTQTAKELRSLLAQTTKQKRKSCTTPLKLVSGGKSA